MGSRPHLKKQDSRFTTCFPEPDLSGFSRASRVGDVAVDNEIIDTGDGGRLLAVDHHNFIGLVMRPGGPDPKATAVKAMIHIIDVRSSFR